MGTNLEADGRSEQDVKIRMALARKQFGSFMNIWQSEEVDLGQKIALYKAGVLSVLVYGHTNWTLSKEVERLNLAVWMELEVPGSDHW